MARPTKWDKIDKKMFEKLCQFQCTILEICDWFDVDENTLEKFCKKTYKASFSQVFRIKRGKGCVSLRRTQWQLAEKNPSMAIFLGKQYLGQSDHVQVEDKREDTKLDEYINAIKEVAKK